MPNIEINNFNYILLLDVIEHLISPERFINSLRQCLEMNPEIKIIASTGNIGFFIPRLMLFFGQFNYGKRGILDITHTRLFTFKSFRNLFIQNGFNIQYESGIPGPFALAFGENYFSNILSLVNSAFIKLSKGFYSYQFYLIATIRPSLGLLLNQSIKGGEN
jgi:hypothetical protein